MRRKVLTIIGITIVSLLVFVIAIFVTFPTDSVRHLAEKKLEQVLKQKQSVEIDSVSISPFLNVTAEGFTMTPRLTSNTPSLSLEGNTYDGFYCAPSVEEQPFIIDKIFVNPNIISTLRKKPSGSFELTMQDGFIEGEVKSQKNIIEANAEGKDISLNEFALLSNFTKMQFYGMLNFNIQRAIIEKNNLAELNADISASNTALCPKRLKLEMSGIPYIDLPFTVFGNIEAHISIDHDKLIIDHLTADGPDLKFDIKGDVTLKSQKNPVPRLNINAVITPSQQWLEDNNMKIIYQVCEKHEDGSVHLNLTGTTKRIKHECGTPIPEPIEEITPPPETKKDDVKPEEEKKAAKDKKEEKKAESKEEKKDDQSSAKEHGERSGVFEAPDAKAGSRRPPEDGEGGFRRPPEDGEDGFRQPPEDGEGGFRRPEGGRGRMNRPGGRMNRGLSTEAENRLNRDLQADEDAANENRRIRRQGRPSNRFRRGSDEDN